MSKYYALNETTAIEYVKENLNYFSQDASLKSKEIGDGNLNLVFRIYDENSDKSLIIKQALPYARCVGEAMPLSIGRNEIEHRILEIQGEITPQYVPEIYHFNDDLGLTAMEDLSDHVILRSGLIELNKYPYFTEHITDFIVNTLIETSDLVLDHKEKKERVKNFINPELCEITEDLVFSEPFYDAERNEIEEKLRPYAKEILWNDKRLKLEASKLKFEFLTNAQALLHGDLHTGSIFVKENSTKVIDPEFAFYGPIGYDLGALIANFILNYIRVNEISEDEKRRDYLCYLENSIIEIFDKFKEKFIKAFKEKTVDVIAKVEGFDEHYLNNIIKDAVGTTGAEIVRRTVGLAHVKDIDSIEDNEKRLSAKIKALKLGKDLILYRETIKDSSALINTLKSIVI